MTTTETQTEAFVAQVTKVIPSLAHRITNLGFGSGKMGLTLFYAYLARYTEQPEYTDQAYRWIDNTIESIDPQRYQGMASLFYRELGELGTALLFLNQHGLLAFDDSRILARLDELLLRFMHRKIDEGDLNIVSGALIAGHYFMHRLDVFPEAKEYLEDLVQGIEKNARRDEQGRCYWRWPVVKSDGVYLGMNCGSAMIIAFLSALYERGIQPSASLPLIRSASNYVLSCRRDNSASLFPIIVGEPVQRRSLLHGDLSVGYGLLHGSQVLQDGHWRQEAVDILHSCCERKTRIEAQMPDASLLYGAGGTAVLFDTAYSLTNDIRLQEAASHWYQAVFTYQEHNNEFLGFRARFNQKQPATNVAFHEGIIGTGIALMQHENRSLPSLAPLLGFI